MKKIIVAFAVLALASLGMYKYIYKDHKNVKKEKAEFILAANDLLNEYKSDFFKADQKYLDKIIVVKGNITEKGASYVTVGEGVTVYFTKPVKVYAGNSIKVKGRLVGYDELLELVKIDNAHVVK